MKSKLLIVLSIIAVTSAFAAETKQPASAKKPVAAKKAPAKPVVAKPAKPVKVDPLYQKVYQHQQMMQYRLRLMIAMKQNDKKAIGEVCTAALKLDPTDAVWQYNYACALADGADSKVALDALEKSIKLGFRDAQKIAGDTDFAKINKLPRFKQLVKLAEKTAKDPIPGVATPQFMEIPAGKRVRMTESNLVWNADLGMYQALVKSDTFLYINRDADHSALPYTAYPGMTRVDFPAGARANGMDTGIPNTLFGGVPVYGNVSQGCIAEPIRRSLLRAAMTGLWDGEFSFKRLATCYLDNQVWCIPAVWDFPGGKDWEGRPMGSAGDVYFPGQCPYTITSVGASWSDQPFLKAILAARGKMRPDTLKAMRERHLVAPTTQWLLRRAQKQVKAPEDYLTSKAHPTAFNIGNLNTNALVKLAAKLKAEAIPPLAILHAVNTKVNPVPVFMPGRDYADTHPEPLYVTPFAMAFVLRAEPGKREFCFTATTTKEAAKGVEYCWKVVHGDAKRVKVRGFSAAETPAKGFARVAIDRIDMTNRIDLACFARIKGKTEWGAPSFISFSVVQQEGRKYNEQGQLLLIDYTNPRKVGYIDGLIALPRKWMDEFYYNADGTLKEVIRTQPGAESRTFSAAAFRKLKYMPRQSADPKKFNELVYAED